MKGVIYINDDIYSREIAFNLNTISGTDLKSSYVIWRTNVSAL